jgi:hypothetical protein
VISSCYAIFDIKLFVFEPAIRPRGEPVTAVLVRLEGNLACDPPCFEKILLDKADTVNIITAKR